MESTKVMSRLAVLFAVLVALSLPSVIRAEATAPAPTPAVAAASEAAAAEAAPKAPIQQRAARPATRSVQPARRGPVSKLVELERRKNEWLRETFLNR
jgi:hypothetical protein